MANEKSFQSGSVGNVAPSSHPRGCRLRRGADRAPRQVMALTRTCLQVTCLYAILISALACFEPLFAGETQDQSRTTLDAQIDDFQSARALPAGSRPSPPDVDLKALPGLNSTRLRSALGPPDHPIKGIDSNVAPISAGYIHMAPSGKRSPP